MTPPRPRLTAPEARTETMPLTPPERLVFSQAGSNGGLSVDSPINRAVVVRRGRVLVGAPW
jgi:hypothetical protein